MYQPDAGEWRAGKIEGVGKFKWANGDEYEGNCSGKLFGNLMCLLLLLFFFFLLSPCCELRTVSFLCFF
jgi:hypothetical protein